MARGEGERLRRARDQRVRLLRQLAPGRPQHHEAPALERGGLAAIAFQRLLREMKGVGVILQDDALTTPQRIDLKALGHRV